MTWLMLASTAKAAPVDDWPRYSKDYDRAVLALLARLPSTREHAAFLLKERLDLVVTDAPDKVGDDVIGCYDLAQRRLYVDQVRLLNGADELLDRGAPESSVGELLAWKMLPTIVHETRHAMSHRELQKIFNAWLALPYVESEQLSFYDQVLSLRDMFKERPKLWSPDKILSIERDNAFVLRAWERDPADLDRVVRRTYAALSSLLDEPREKLVEKANDRVKDWEGLAAEDPAKYAKGLALYRATAAVLSDEASFERLRAYFRDALARGRARLREAKP